MKSKLFVVFDPKIRIQRLSNTIFIISPPPISKTTNLNCVGNTSTAMAARMEAAQPEHRLMMRSTVAAIPSGTNAAPMVAMPQINIIPPGYTEIYKKLYIFHSLYYLGLLTLLIGEK